MIFFLDNVNVSCSVISALNKSRIDGELHKNHQVWLNKIVFPKRKMRFNMLRERKKKYVSRASIPKMQFLSANASVSMKVTQTQTTTTVKKNWVI